MVFVIGAVASAWPAVAEVARYVRIGTGPIGGSYFPVGGLIANTVSGPPGSTACAAGGSCGVPGLIVTAISTQGSVDNVQQLAKGSVEFAMCQADVAHDAWAGADSFAGRPVATLRAVAHLFPEALHVVVRRGDKPAGVRDLKRRRVGLGETNSGTLETARAVLRGFGLGLNQIAPVFEKPTRSADELVAGDLDAFFLVGGEPVVAIALAAERTPIALLPIAGRDAERILRAEPLLSATTIPADTYAGVPATPTIAVGAQLLVREAVPDDLVYALTRALWEPRNRRVLDAGGPIGRRIRPQSALDRLGVPLHPGARRWYEEAGMLSAAETTK